MPAGRFPEYVIAFGVGARFIAPEGSKLQAVCQLGAGLFGRVEALYFA